MTSPAQRIDDCVSKDIFNGRIYSGIAWFESVFKGLVVFFGEASRVRWENSHAGVLLMKAMCTSKGWACAGAEPGDIVSKIWAGLGHDFLILAALSHAWRIRAWYNKGWWSLTYAAAAFNKKQSRCIKMLPQVWISLSWALILDTWIHVFPTFIVTPLLRLRHRHLWMKGEGFPRFFLWIATICRIWQCNLKRLHMNMDEYKSWVKATESDVRVCFFSIRWSS